MYLEGIEKSRLFQRVTAKELSSCLASLDAREKIPKRRSDSPRGSANFKHRHGTIRQCYY